MEATGAVLGTATGAFELLDRVELYVNRYFERRDLAEDSVALHLRLLEEHRTALQLIEMTERQSNFDREPVCNQFIRSRLHVIRSRLEHNNNDLNALNSTLSNAGATRRVRRANARLKNHEKDITEFYSFVNDTVIPALRENSPAIQTPSVSYTTSSNVPPNPPRLTLQYENEDTCEGELKAAILEGSGSTVVGVVASGLGGVGKSCAVRGLATVREIKDRFHGGLLYIELGNDAGIADIIKGISRIVERTGDVQLAATIRGEKYLQDASDKAAPWFRGRKCLFVVDDIWWVNGITSNVFTILGTMLHDESLLVYTTRDDRFLRGANRIVRFEEKEAHGELARRMLLTHAGFDSDADFSAANRQALTGILDICGGLPLALGIAGSTIWTHQEKREGDKQDVFTDYYRSLQSQEDNIFKGSAENYGPLRLIVDNSIEVLESESSETDRVTKRKIGELFRALCVLKKQQRAYGEMLQKLWDMDSLGETREVAEKMHEVSLVRMTLAGGNVFYVQLHDLVLDIATRKASERYEKKAHFSTLADNYMQKMVDGADLLTAQIEKRQLFRAWWTVSDDGYIVDNVCRVLDGAGEAEEVLWLLERAQWVVMRLQKYGISGVEDDVRIAEEASRKASTEHGAALKYLDMIRSAARMSCGAVSRNACEAWFQLHGRVAWYAEQCNKTSAFIAEIEHHAPRPWVKPQAGFLLGAGGAALDSVQATGRLLCISHGKDLVRFVSTYGGDVFVTEYDRRYGNQTRYALVGNKRSKGVTEGAAASSVGEDEAGTERQKCYCAAFSKDMKKVITGHEDGSVLVWDIDRGYKLDGRVSMHVDDTDVAAEERRVRGKLDSLRNMCCGMWKSEGTIREAASSRVRSERSAVKWLAVSADGSKIVCGSPDGNVSVRSCGSGAVGDALDALPGSGSVEGVAVSSDARRVVCVQGSDIHVWDGGCGKWLAVPAELENVGVECAAVSADGERIVCGTEGGAVLVWDVNSSESSVRSMSGHSELVLCVALSSDGRVAVSGSYDHTVRVWDADKGEMLGAPLRGHASYVRHVALSADCKEAVSASEGGSVRVWDVQRNVETAHYDERFTTALQCFVYGGHGTRAVFGSDDGGVRLMDVESGRVVGQPLRGHTGAVKLVALSGDGSRIVSASLDRTVRVWDANSGAAVGAPLTDVDAWCVAVSDDGTRAVAGQLDGALVVFDTRSGRVIARPRGGTGAVWCCALSSDGARVASGGADDTVRIWDVAPCSAVAPPLRGHTDRVRCVAWSADGKRVVSASDDGTVRVWDVDTAQPVGDALVHGEPVRHVQTDAHGSRVLSVDRNGYGRLWDVTRAECLITSSDSAWAQTVRNFGLARFEMGHDWYPNMEIMWRDAAGRKQVLASADTRVFRVGDKYFAVEHGPSSVPFCQVQHASHSV